MNIIWCFGDLYKGNIFNKDLGVMEFIYIEMVDNIFDIPVDITSKTLIDKIN